MRASNKLVREWLLKEGYDDIWFKPHGTHNDYVFTQKGSYMAQDIWNLFDGICTGAGVVFLQMKTNAWAKEKPFRDFVKKHGCLILSFNVSNKHKDSKGRYKVMVRQY